MNAPATPTANGNKRKALLLTITGLFALLGIGYGAYWLLVSRNYETTDNAYVQGNVVQLTPQISGTVLAIDAQDTDFVKAGQEVIKLDPADAQVALDQAQAQLAQTVREVRTLYANNATLGANVALRQAELARANAELARAQEDYARRQPLVATGAVSSEELEHSRTALAAARSAQASAQAAVAAAQEALVSNRALTEGVSVAQHPNVLRAAARVREAYLARQRAELLAPVSGFVAKRSVQVGQRIAPGVPLMAIVPLNEVWVDANFKEVQLRNMRIDQPVTLTADLYGNKVVYHGKVAGLGAGTGAAFSLLPAQNATGNWIKVVQRVPVRVALEPAELAAHPLRIGLSMEVEVDIRNQSGKMLADRSATGTGNAVTPAFTQADRGADALVDRIIAANLGRRAASGAALAARNTLAAPRTANRPAGA